jgi:hypothetical protein
VLRDFLTRVGDEVATAATGVEALEVVPTFKPEVILLDMVMPGMSGADVLDALRRAGVTVPVILMSGQPIAPPKASLRFSENRSIYGSWPSSLRRPSATPAPTMPDARGRMAATVALSL